MFKKIFTMTVLTALLVGVMALALPAAVNAQATTPQPQTPAEKGVKVDTRLENIYTRLQKLMAAQTERLSKVDARLPKMQEMIANAKARGKDVSALEAGLVKFQEKLTAAHKAHDAASAVLKTHAGFDANGKVIDRKAAATTVREAGKELNNARKNIEAGIRNWLQALREFRQNNKPEKPVQP